MPNIKVESAVVGDILQDSVFIKGVSLFDAGTVLTKQRLDVLTVLGVKTVTVESRTDEKYETVADALKRIDERFSFVEGIPFMMILKSRVQEIVREMGVNHG